VAYDEHHDNNTSVSIENTEKTINLQSINIEKPSASNIETVTSPCIKKVNRHEKRSSKVFSILESMHNDKKSRREKRDNEKKTIG